MENSVERVEIHHNSPLRATFHHLIIIIKPLCVNCKHCAKISCEESPSLEDLKSLEAQGVEILTCGTCLNHYGLTDKLKVGEVTNMYVIAEKMTQADLIVKP